MRLSHHLPRLARPVPTLAAPARVALAVASLALAGMLAGCDTPEKFAPACPQLGLLRDAADITRFRPGGQDVTDMVLDARITAVPADCARGEGSTVRARLHVTMDISRGPAARGRGAVVPYFVAVTDGDRVLDEQDYTVGTEFAANTDRASVSGEDITLKIPVTPQKSAAAYKIWIGFRLSPDELAYNRRRGVR
jgi:hypothetical protein